MWENKLERKYLLNFGVDEEFGRHVREEDS